MTFYSPTLKKGKVRVRVVDESINTRNFFCLTTKDSQITEKNEFAGYLTLTWDQPQRIPLWTCESKGMVNIFCLNTNKTMILWRPTLPYWKRVRLGLGLGGETSRRLELLPRKKGKVRVRVRVVDESMKTRNIFCLTTKNDRNTRGTRRACK